MGPFIFLDVETTGVDPNRDHLIEIACVKWDQNGISDKFETLVNPGVPIPKEISVLTGITDNDVKKSPRFSEVGDEIFSFIGDLPIVGHNIPFDTGFLKSHNGGFNNKEINTVILAHILLCNESSYALEVLTKKYLASQNQSHRAMSDTLVTVDFFEFLLGKIAEIPEEAFNKINDVLKKSEWTLKTVFEKKYPQYIKTTTVPQEVEKPRKNLNEEKYWSPEITDGFLSGQKLLCQSPFSPSLDKLAKKQTVIAYCTEKGKKKILKQAENLRIPYTDLKDPFFYISPKKLAKKMQQKTFEEAEIPLLLKLILWSSWTLTGDRAELSLDHSQYPLFEQYADEEGVDVYWEKALARVKKSKITMIHQGALSKGLLGKIGGTGVNLIILEGSQLEESFTKALKEKYSRFDFQSCFGEKSDLLFGLVGIFYNQFAERNEYSQNGCVILDETARNSVQWKRVLEAFANLPDHPKKQQIIDSFCLRENYIQWIEMFAEEIYFCAAPVSLAEIFRVQTSNSKNIMIHSDYLSSDGSFSLIRSLFKLGEDWKDVKEEISPWYGDLKIEIAKNMPDPNTESYFRSCLKLFGKILEEKKGKTLLVLNSKKTVETVYIALLPAAIKCGTRLIAVGPSGGIGKSLSLFLADPENSVLMVTNGTLSYFDSLEPYLDTIVFQKIPFDHPNDPVLSERAKQFPKGFDDYTLLRAAMKFREILIDFGKQKNGEAKNCYLLDGRILTRDYGYLFI